MDLTVMSPFFLLWKRLHMITLLLKACLSAGGSISLLASAVKISLKLLAVMCNGVLFCFLPL